jgi:hypothetical protein
MRAFSGNLGDTNGLRHREVLGSQTFERSTLERVELPPRV